MTLVDRRADRLPVEPELVTDRTALGVFRRPTNSTGWRSWVFTVDHKKIGIMYGVAAHVLLPRRRLRGAADPRPAGRARTARCLSADLYNQMFTMHGTTMVFLVRHADGGGVRATTCAAADRRPRRRLPPPQRLRLLVLPVRRHLPQHRRGSSAARADGGWFMLRPEHRRRRSRRATASTSGRSACMITGIASLTGAINLIVTVLNMRAPGMTLMKMPVFTWMILVTQFLLLFAIPVHHRGAVPADVRPAVRRQRSSTSTHGADPLLWQHLFWIFGHPEVYILILPELRHRLRDASRCSRRKPLFGYPFMVFSGIAIGFMGWGVWAHHMFASGIGPISVAVFSVSTMFIAVPTGVKILNWIATMWGGKLRFTTAMLFAIGLVVDVHHRRPVGRDPRRVAPSDTQQTDTYYIVAHFHYVLFGGAVLGFFAGFYYWWPKVFG